VVHFKIPNTRATNQKAVGIIPETSLPLTMQTDLSLLFKPLSSNLHLTVTWWRMPT